MNFVPDIISEDELKRIRRTVWIGQEILCYQVIDSTNRKAKDLAADGYLSGTLVVAEQQEAGRGRSGRSWDSPQGSGISMSLLLKPEIAPDRASMLTLVAALAVGAAVEKQTGKSADIKWPNDLVMNGKKICGILTEMGMQGSCVDYIVVGIGINVHNESFAEELSDKATSLFLETGVHPSRAAIIGEILEQFERYYEIFLSTEDLSRLVEEYDRHLVNCGRTVRVLDPKEPFVGTARGITAAGELIVDTGEGRRLVSAGEVSVRGIYGYV